MMHILKTSNSFCPIAQDNRIIVAQKSQSMAKMTLLFLTFMLVLSSTANLLSQEVPKRARDAFNEGTRKLQQNKLREAEALLIAATASNEEAIQPKASYNLGHVRFQQGIEVLKNSPQPETVRQRADMTSNLADQAIIAAQDALQKEQIEALVAAYMRGRGARKQLKSAIEAVKQALDAHGTVLNKWQRSSGDFKSTVELSGKDEDASFNADLVDRQIALLIDKINALQMAMQMLGKKMEELAQKMKELRGKLPDGMLPGGEEEEEEEKEESKGSEKEQTQKEGKEMMMSWEEAARLLDALKLDANRKLPMGQNQTDPPKKRTGREW